MNILFVHQNFPGQFKFLAPALVRLGHTVLATTLKAGAPAKWQGVTLRPYKLQHNPTAQVHPWAKDIESKIIRADACFRCALQLKAEGFTPDIIIAHPGWGESLFLKDVWPQARLGLYCEFFYIPVGNDVGFDPEFPVADPGNACRVRLKNLHHLLQFEQAHSGIAPTHWQASTFPEPFRSKISVVHDGIDTARLAPNAATRITLNGQVSLGHEDEVITFVNRNLEPYRGYHIFMRALPELLRRRPKAHVIIVGDKGVSYGAAPPAGQTWMAIFQREVRHQISAADWQRVHFLGKVNYANFLAVLQVSTVHVYLTYPFVLSWSLLEAMSMGCTIVASDTRPLHEAIVHDETGRLVNFFDPAALTDEVVALLQDPEQRARLGANARAFAIQHYDLQSVCLPGQLQWVAALAGQAGPP